MNVYANACLAPYLYHPLGHNTNIFVLFCIESRKRIKIGSQKKKKKLFYCEHQVRMTFVMHLFANQSLRGENTD